MKYQGVNKRLYDQYKKLKKLERDDENDLLLTEKFKVLEEIEKTEKLKEVKRLTAISERLSEKLRIMDTVRNK